MFQNNNFQMISDDIENKQFRSNVGQNPGFVFKIPIFFRSEDNVIQQIQKNSHFIEPYWNYLE